MGTSSYHNKIHGLLWDSVNNFPANRAGVYRDRAAKALVHRHGREQGIAMKSDTAKYSRLVLRKCRSHSRPSKGLILGIEQENRPILGMNDFWRSAGRIEIAEESGGNEGMTSRRWFVDLNGRGICRVQRRRRLFAPLCNLAKSLANGGIVMIAVVDKFERIGVRARVREFTHLITRRNARDPQVRLNILHDKKGAFFDIQVGKEVELLVLDVQPKMRHLLLMTRVHNKTGGEPVIKSKFLCGHDERDWFIAAIRRSDPVSSVRTAMESLKPAPVRVEQQKQRLAARNLNRRKNKAFLRQGEFFFVPKTDVQVDPQLVLKKEPLEPYRRKPHTAEYLYRTAKMQVYMSKPKAQDLTFEALNRLPANKRRIYRPEVRMSRLFVRGKIVHADHKTLELGATWHEVFQNHEIVSGQVVSVEYVD